MYQQHIENRSACDGKQHIFSPQMKQDATDDSKYLRYAIIPFLKFNILKAIDDKDAEHCTRKALA